MIFEFFRFELRQQLRSPLLWLLAAMFGLFAFGAASTDAIQVGNAIGNVNRNAPTVIVSFLGVFSLLGLLIIVSFVSGALFPHAENCTRAGSARKTYFRRDDRCQRRPLD